MARARGAWLVMVALCAATAQAAAEPAPLCKGCTLDAPAARSGADRALPLLVLLHGDRQAAATLASWWKKPALAHGFAVLALQCPRDRKCDDSYWKWDGDPQWVFDQVATAEARLAVDPARVYLVGWSGGASWIGWRAQAWSAVFAAVVLHGGGIAPRDEGCPAHGLPAYFLVGAKNPLHELAVALRGYFDGCKADVVWDVLPRADHAGEEAALTGDAKKAAAILDWLGAHARGKEGT
jgi:poly(3-hydroxybutyrate) depolymerase